MKKILLTCMLSAGALYLSAQESPETASKKEQKMSHSFLWGLFQSKDYPADSKAIAFDFQTSLDSLTRIDTTKYEEKSALWGSIKWTVKKKKEDDDQSNQ